MHNILYFLFGLPKTLIINFKYFSWHDAWRLPIWVTFRCRLRALKGEIKIEAPLKPGMIKIGYGDVGVIDNHERASFSNDGLIIFKGKTNIGVASKIDNHAILVFGKNFVATAKTSITCYCKITFGDDVLVSWDTSFMDTDVHKVFDSDHHRINEDKSINIGNQVWIGFGTTVLKGSFIPNGCVIGANSTITKCYTQEKSIIVGNVGKTYLSGISWEV